MIAVFLYIMALVVLPLIFVTSVVFLVVSLVQFLRKWRQPLGTCEYAHFIRLGVSGGTAFYRVGNCFEDARHRLPNGKLRCDEHEAFPENTFTDSE